MELLHKTGNKTRNIDIEVTDLTFTPFACASVINEIIKSLLYHKSQIPYPYNWLATAVKKKRDKGNASNTSDSNGAVNMKVQKNYEIASDAYDTLELILKNLKKQFTDDKLRVFELVLVFGPTPYTPKEVFSIRIPRLAKGHYESNHKEEIIRNQHKILRELFFSDVWLDAMNTKISNTNMYVMLKKTVTVNEETDFFVMDRNYFLPCNSKCVCVNINYKNSTVNCCRNLTVFSDNNSCETNTIYDDEQKIDVDFSDSVWYLGKALFKGFNDYVIDKLSASNMW